jgi:hypothetical protein
VVSALVNGREGCQETDVRWKRTYNERGKRIDSDYFTEE